MYSHYMHGIEERQEDRINRGIICNFDRCSDETKDKDEQILTRTTRVSLTIRRAEKTSKFQIGMLHK
jgi:hypothetical protein